MDTLRLLVRAWVPVLKRPVTFCIKRGDEFVGALRLLVRAEVSVLKHPLIETLVLYISVREEFVGALSL